MNRMKRTFIRIIALVLCAAMVFPIPAGAVSLMAEQLEEDQKMLTLGNTLVQVRINQKTGRYTVATEDGLPNKTSDRNRLLSFFDTTPDTSFTTIRIDGKDYIFGNDYGFQGGIVSATTVQGTTATTVWQLDGVQVTQQLRLITDFADPDVGNVRIRYEIANGSGKSVQLGSRILLDTMLGANDGSAMLVDRLYVTNETAFSGEQVPMVWQSSDQQYAANVTAQGILYGWEDGLRPDKMVAAHWNTLANTKWDCQINPYLNFSTNKNQFGRADSAVALYYDPSELPAGETRIYETYYGIGSISDTVGTGALSVQINAPQKLTLDSSGEAYASGSDPFDVVVQVTNVTDEKLSNVSIELGLSDGLQLADGTNAVYADLDAQGSYTQTFRVSPTLPDATTVAQLGVQVTCGDLTAEGMKYVIVPGRKGELPKVQITEIAPATLYTGSVEKKVTLKGTGFSLLLADNDWSVTLLDDLTGRSSTLSKAAVSIADDATMTVSLPANRSFDYTPGQYTLRLVTERYGSLSAALDMTDDPNFDRIEYGVMLVGKMQDDEGKDYYGVRLLEQEEEMEALSQQELDSILLTIRGTIGTYEMGGHEYYTIGNGAIINSAIRYRNSFNSEAVITVTRYSDLPEADGLGQQFRNQFQGWQWFGKVSDSLVFTGEGGLYVGDYLFHVGQFYICLEDENNYELRGADDDSNNEDLNDNISDDEIQEGFRRTQDVEIITPAGVVGSQLTKTVGALTGFQVEIANAVLGTETISLGGSISVCLPWWSKAADGGDDGDAKKSALETKYDKNDGLNNIESGTKTDNFLELNLEEMRYGQNAADNSAYLVGVKADGSIELTDDSMPKFTSGGAGASFQLDSIDYPGWFIGVDGHVKVGDAFECEFGLSLVREDSGQCYPDSMKFIMGGDVVKIPLGLAGFLTRMGGGLSGLYDTIKGNFNIFPPTTITLYTGYADPTTITFTVDEVDMSVGGQGIQFEAREGKIIGLRIFESIGAHLKIYGTKMDDGSVVPCIDVGMDTKINILGIIRGESGFWLVADPRLNTVFGPLSLGGKAYVGIFIPDYIPVLGGKELLSAMAELSSYRAYAGIRILGIPISVSYYWADGEVKFFDDWAYLAEEFSIPEEDLQNALAVTYDAGDANVDGVLLFGDNMTNLTVLSSGTRSGYSYEVAVRNNDYSFFEIRYDADALVDGTGILDHVTLSDPSGKAVTLTENENCLLQHISKEVSNSGVDEYYLAIGLTAPQNGTWTVESDIPLQMEAHKVDEVAGLQTKSAESDGSSITVDYQVTGAQAGASLDAYLVNVSEVAAVPQALSEESLAELSEEALSSYYRARMDADPSGFKITEAPISIRLDQDGNASGHITVPIPANTQSGEYMVRLVLNDETGNAVSSDRTENAFVYVNPNTPEPVSGFTMVPGGDGQFRMQWDASDDAEEYFVTLLDENGDPVEGVTGVTTADNKLYFGYRNTEVTYLTDGEGRYVTDANGERIISGSRTVGVEPGRKYIGVVAASKTVNGTTYLSEAVKTAPVELPVPNPATLTYTLNGKSLTHAVRTVEDGKLDTQILLEDAYTGQSNSSAIRLTVTADQDISYLLEVDGVYLTDENGNIIDHSLRAGETATHSISLADGGSSIGICALNKQGDYTRNTITVDVDTTPPELMLDSSVVLSEHNRYTITGTAENNCSVVVNGQNAEVSNGRFVYEGVGTGSTQQITVVAQDRAGNCTKRLCDVIPAELSGLVGLSIAVDGLVVDSNTQKETMYAGNQAQLSFYGILSNGSTIELDSSKVDCAILMGDGAVTLSGATVTALHAGDAVLIASFPLTDSYQLEQTLMLTVAQQPITPAEIRLSDTVIPADAAAGSVIANLSIPGAPADLTTQWRVADNDYLEVQGQSLVLKQLPSAAFTVEVSVTGTYHDDTGALREYEVSDLFGFDLLKKVEAVEGLSDLAVNYGTTYDALPLPDTVAVRLSTGETIGMQVQWSRGVYHEALAGHCTIYGDLILPDGIRNPDEVRAALTVNLQKLTTNTEASNRTCTYDGQPVDVSGLFTVDPNAGKASYSIAGGSGQGTLNGSLLTVTKAGTFTICLTTAATASHQEASVSAVLTVAKGSRRSPAGLTASNTQTTITYDGTISGVTPDMEYSSDGGYHWQPVTGNTVTGLRCGNYLVRYGESDLWLCSEAVPVQILATGKASQEPLTLSMEATAVYGDAPLNISVRGGSGDGEITFHSSEESVLTIENGEAVIHGAGKAIITATKGEDETYNAAADSLEVTVAPRTLELAWSGCDERTYDGNPSAVSVRACNLIGEDTCEIQLQGHQAVHAGAYTAVALKTDNPNYCLPEHALQSYRIVPAPVQIQWAQQPELTYTGRDLQDQIAAFWTDLEGKTHEAVLNTEDERGLLHAGTYTVTAATGDSNYLAAADTALEVTVAKAEPVIALTVAAEEETGLLAGLKQLLHFNTKQTLCLTATVTGVDEQAQTGKVEFFCNGESVGEKALEAGQAAVKVRNLKLGESTIYAVFTPDEASTDHNGGTSLPQVCQIDKPIPAAPDTVALATSSAIRVVPLSEGSVAKYGAAQYRIDHGDWQSENEFTGLMAAKTYTVQVRYAGNAEYAPSVAQTIYVTTTYELIIPAEMTANEGGAEIAVSDNISLAGREVRISIVSAHSNTNEAGSAYDPETGLLTLTRLGDPAASPVTAKLMLLINGLPVSGEQIAVITEDTPDKTLKLSLGEAADGSQLRAGTYECHITFKAELADVQQSHSDSQGDLEE